MEQLIKSQVKKIKVTEQGLTLNTDSALKKGKVGKELSPASTKEKENPQAR